MSTSNDTVQVFCAKCGIPLGKMILGIYTNLQQFYCEKCHAKRKKAFTFQLLPVTKKEDVTKE